MLAEEERIPENQRFFMGLTICIILLVVGSIFYIAYSVVVGFNDGTTNIAMGQSMKAMARMQPILDAGCNTSPPTYRGCGEPEIHFRDAHIIALRTVDSRKNIRFVFYTSHRFYGRNIRQIGISRLNASLRDSKRYYIVNSPCDGVYASRTAPSAALGGCRDIP